MRTARGIVNPAAGAGRTATQWPDAIVALHEAGLNLLTHLYNGSHIRHAGVRYGTPKRVRVEPATPQPVVVDGEPAPGALPLLAKEVRAG